jgi:hypothetical protein
VDNRFDLAAAISASNDNGSEVEDAGDGAG